MILGQRYFLSSSSDSLIFIIGQIARYPLEISPNFELAYRLKLLLFFRGTPEIILMIISITVESAFRENVILRQWYFLGSLRLPLVQIVIYVAGAALEWLFAESNLAFGYELFWGFYIIPLTEVINIRRLP